MSKSSALPPTAWIPFVVPRRYYSIVFMYPRCTAVHMLLPDAFPAPPPSSGLTLCQSHPTCEWSSRIGTVQHGDYPAPLLPTPKAPCPPSSGPTPSCSASVPPSSALPPTAWIPFVVPRRFYSIVFMYPRCTAVHMLLPDAFPAPPPSSGLTLCQSHPTCEWSSRIGTVQHGDYPAPLLPTPKAPCPPSSGPTPSCSASVPPSSALPPTAWIPFVVPRRFYSIVFMYPRCTAVHMLLPDAFPAPPPLKAAIWPDTLLVETVTPNL